MIRPLVAVASILFNVALAQAAAIKIVAAENVYGDIARQIGGDHVAVISIIFSPAQDPHLFEASASVAIAVSHAEIVIYNGLDYDPWMEKLAAASAATQRNVLVAGELSGFKTGDNPHVWYDLKTVSILAKALAEKLVARDPAHADDYRQNQIHFEASLLPITSQIAQVAAAHKATPVAATEPVFGHVLMAMGLDVKETEFQRAVMNDTEPSISDVARFEADLKSKNLKLLVFNKQAASPLVEKMVTLAKANAIPVVGVTETEPQDRTYQQWLSEEVSATAAALDAH
jgi:zinc/manganese transport system substrate-binding protein